MGRVHMDELRQLTLVGPSKTIGEAFDVSVPWFTDLLRDLGQGWAS